MRFLEKRSPSIGASSSIMSGNHSVCYPVHSELWFHPAYMSGLESPALGETKTTTRMNKKLVRFEYPFLLEEIEKELPAGDYTIETEEESIDGMSFQAFRRVETTLIVRPPNGKPGVTTFWTIDPEALSAALARDAERSKNSKSETHNE